MRKLIESQFQNLFLFAPFVMAFGAALYFIFPTEPNISYPLIIAALSMAIIIFRKPGVMLTGALLFIFGFFYAAGFTRLIDTPQLLHNLREKSIIGIVTNIDYTDEKARIFIKTSDVVKKRNTLVRVSLDQGEKIPKIGDKINAVVTLFKPSGADAPNSFDYARWAYFNGITATGYMNSYAQLPGRSDNFSPGH